MTYFAGASAADEIRERITTLKRSVTTLEKEAEAEERRLADTRADIERVKAMHASYEEALVKITQ